MALTISRRLWSVTVIKMLAGTLGHSSNDSTLFAYLRLNYYPRNSSNQGTFFSAHPVTNDHSFCIIIHLIEIIYHNYSSIFQETCCTVELHYRHTREWPFNKNDASNNSAVKYHYQNRNSYLKLTTAYQKTLIV